MWPWARASYIAPCPRRCTPDSESSGRDVTGPVVHSTASVSSNRASARSVRHSYSSRRNRDNPASASTRAAPSCRLCITAFGLIDCRLQREDTITQRPPSCQANDEPHQDMILVGFKAKLKGGTQDPISADHSRAKDQLRDSP